MSEIWDVIVVGGGAAGLSAALVLGRARRRTLVVDAGRQSNLPAEGIGGLLGADGRPAAEFYAAARQEIAAYPTVELREGEVGAARRGAGGFELDLAGGELETARRLLLATGMDYRFPDLPGIAERWGRTAFHCPFCHGWELRERPLAILARGAKGLQAGLLLTAWSDDVALLSNGPDELEPEERERLAAAGVELDDRPVAALEGPADGLTAIAFSDGSRRPCEGLMVPVTLHQRSQIPKQLGAAFAAPSPMGDETVEADAKFATSVPGLFAAGDVSSQMLSVANAVAAGSTAAAAIMHSLTAQLNAN